MGKYIKIMLQVLLAYIIFTILGQYFQTYILVIILLVFIGLFLLYGSKRKDKNLLFLEKDCDVEKYIDYIKENKHKKNQSSYLLYLSYGQVFNGNFEEAALNMEEIDPSLFKPKEILLFEEIKLKLLYNNNDLKGYEDKWDEVSEGRYGNMFHNDVLVLKAPLLLMKEEYESLVNLMFDLIPKQRKAYRVIELEYYLALAYKAQGKDEDAVAVLEFVTKRDFKLDHVRKGHSLLNKLKSN